jgi:hypothetical protein
VSVFPLGQRHLRGIDEPERVFEIAIDDLEPTARTSVVQAEPDEPSAEKPAERDLDPRLEDFGARLAAAIQERVLGSLDAKLDRVEGVSAVDDIASRFESLGDEIDARVRAALARKGVAPSDETPERGRG